MKLDLSRHDPLRKDITRLLRDAIIRGDLSPGERLIEPEIADKLGVSRTPVREALLKLETEGLVKFFPRKGAIVAPYSIKEVGEIYDVLISLEPLAAKVASDRMKGEHIRHLEVLEKSFEQVDDQMEKIEANSAFHQWYISLCSNDLLREMVVNLNHKLDRYRRFVFTDKSRVNSALFEHKNIIDAFKDHDSKRIQKLVQKHLAISKKSLIAYLNKIKLEGGRVDD